ncbi:MAG: PEP-CTERM sorting domain-containing protein [Phycisphaerales bacterium JB052]
MKNTILVGAIAAAATLASAGNVKPDVIFGSGNANGGFTVTESNNIEIGLRGKLRYNSSGSPENTFNYDGVDTYTFNPNDSANPANRSLFNFEFSVNTDVNDPTNSGNNINDFTYMLTVSRLNDSGIGTTELFAFDPFNSVNPGNGEVLWDHAMGDNGTGNGNGVEATDATNYASLLASSNVIQQSWNLGFFFGDPDRKGTYFVSLEAFDGMTTVASNDITINVVPVPTAAFAGLGLLGVLGGARVIRRR